MISYICNTYLSTVRWYRLISFTNFNAQFLYSLTICMLHYNPRHVSSINMPIFRRTNCIMTASGIVTLCKRLYSIPDESRLQSRLVKEISLYYDARSKKHENMYVSMFVLNNFVPYLHPKNYTLRNLIFS